LLSHTVAQRRREIGIRMALGARADDVVRLVARNSLAMVGIGVIAGLMGAAAISRAARAVLFEVSALEPTAYAFAALAMAAVAVAAAAFPARRATQVDPASALRREA
jgi:ABC-type antimicrobial peptide transport system permease subunit